MKSLLIIPVVLAAVVGGLAAVLTLAGVHVRLAEPLSAGAIATFAGSLGIIPIILRRTFDAAEAWQTALAGTVIHLMVTIIGAAGLVLAGVVNARGPFPFWLIGAYWISLILMVIELRQFALKVHGKC